MVCVSVSACLLCNDNVMHIIFLFALLDDDDDDDKGGHIGGGGGFDGRNETLSVASNWIICHCVVYVPVRFGLCNKNAIFDDIWPISYIRPHLQHINAHTITTTVCWYSQLYDRIWHEWNGFMVAGAGAGGAILFWCRLALNGFTVTIYLIRTLVCTLFIMYQSLYFPLSTIRHSFFIRIPFHFSSTAPNLSRPPSCSSFTASCFNYYTRSILRFYMFAKSERDPYINEGKKDFGKSALFAFFHFSKNLKWFSKKSVWWFRWRTANHYALCSLKFDRFECIKKCGSNMKTQYE